MRWMVLLLMLWEYRFAEGADRAEVQGWFNYLASQSGISLNSVASYLGGYRTIYIQRVGPDDPKLGEEMEHWGLVPWGVHYDMDVDGMYQWTSGNVYQRSAYYDEEPEEVVQFNFDKLDFRFDRRRKDSNELIASSELLVFGSHGPFDEYSCMNGYLHIVWLKNTRQEIARLKCVPGGRWRSMFQWSSAQTCVRYASGMVKSLEGRDIGVELIGEMEVLVRSSCQKKHFDFGINIRATNNMPFNIHVKTSFGYHPIAVRTDYPIEGEYELDMSLGRSHWHKNPHQDQEEREFYMDFYWDRLVIMDTATGIAAKEFMVPNDNSLIYAKCLKGMSSSLWDSEASKEVARIWCGPRDMHVSTQRTQPMCWQFPSGQCMSLPNQKAIQDWQHFFPEMFHKHINDCTVAEEAIFQKADTTEFLYLVIVGIVTVAACALVCLVVIVISFYCCYTRIVPISRKRKAGFRRVMKAPMSAEDWEADLPGIVVHRSSERAPDEQATAA
eukprot:GHVS01063207.1.p1 GENE.GHVS01063207.1~~GHVS01063207.1.p1  ORF type:complete len:498 (+),score=48.35 GHVS01063207.1:16-1509(+)